MKEVKKEVAIDPLRVVLGTHRVSYVHIKEPSSFEEDGEKKYDVTFLIPKEHPDIAKIEKAIKTAYAANKESIFKGKPLTSPKLWQPLRDGDEYADEKDGSAEEYRGCMFIKATSKTRPKIFTADKDDLLDLDEVYSGCYCRGVIKCAPFNNKAAGFAFYLNSLMKMKDGEPLGGFSANVDDYDEPDDSDEALT